ncbi:MAG: nitroreductase [Desulfobacterales bacterium CG23_combo_of_CG06-09_8_20_14_all_51_8]|nr:MAG: nitroreductase [Desulfobacterales bacterium CG23_combo_of_CG06-09_8_20_14_all_51_8]
MLDKLKDMILPRQTTFSKITVIDEKCTGCGRCVKSCPIQLLMLDADNKCRSNQRYDAFRCITCQNCMAVCPAEAIAITGEYRVGQGFWKNDDLFETPMTFPDPLGQGGLTNAESATDKLTETEKVIYGRRSIRLYQKKQVPRDLIHRMIEAGRFAPSAGNSQPWKFIVIRNPALIDEINSRCKKALRVHTRLTLPKAWLDKKIPGDPDARFAWWQKIILPLLVKLRPGDTDQRVRGGVNTVTSDPEYHIFFHAPTLILQLADRRAIGGVDYDSGICFQNMVLTAHALGLGTCYVGLIDGLKLHPRFRREVLGVVDPFEIVMALAVGFPSGKIGRFVRREKPRVIWFDGSRG